MSEVNTTTLSELGKPLYWDLEAHLKAVNQMILADELQIALQMMDQVPGWYRDNYPQELAEMKARLYKQTYDQAEYGTDDDEANCTREFGEEQWTNGYMYPRAEIIAEIVRRYNAGNTVPWIYDLGCSHGNLPLGLIKDKHEFSYYGRGMNWRIQEKVKNWIGEKWMVSPGGEQPRILYCTEVLEHMFNPHDLIHSAYKVGVDFDKIVLSTPLYTLGGGLPEWRHRRVGHVRTWTPKEFQEFATKSLPGYQWTYYHAYSMVLCGSR